MEGKLWDWVKKVKELREKNSATDNSMVITRAKEGCKEVKKNIGGINGDGRLDLG